MAVLTLAFEPRMWEFQLSLNGEVLLKVYVPRGKYPILSEVIELLQSIIEKEINYKISKNEQKEVEDDATTEY